MPPAVSVVVPARDAAATLPRTLRALAAQAVPGGHEVVVVDDGSVDATGELAAAAGARVVRLAQALGPAGARNAGVAATTAPLLAFTDADCEPAPGWLAALVAALAQADLVTGPVLPASDPGPWDRTLHLTGPSPLFETANLAVRREAFDRVGGFTAVATGPGLRPRAPHEHFGEDARFGRWALRAGARSAFAQDAVVHHAVFARGPGAFVAERWRLRFFPALVRELPELRRSFPAGLFLSRRTARTDLAVAGLALAARRRQPLALLAALPYLAGCVPGGRPWQPWALKRGLVLAAADLTGCAALAVGSLAARRPFL